MDRREPPETEEGWYVLHDLRQVEWDAWRSASERDRQAAIDEGVEYLRAHEDLADAEAGGSAVFGVLGHEADLLIFHMRPSTGDLDLVERRFEQTALADFTNRIGSYVSVTEVSGYTTDALQKGGIEDVEDAGLRNYLQTRLYPTIPDAAHVCFYPMDKRRGPGDNWYDLPFDERTELMAGHGEIGREYAGRVTQIITGSVGLDDHEWGVTLFADDPTDIKHLLYEMRFDPSTSRYAEFGSFAFGRRFPPEDLGAFLTSEEIPTEDSDDGSTGETVGLDDPERSGPGGAAAIDASETGETAASSSPAAAPHPGGSDHEETTGTTDGAAGGRPDADPSHDTVEPADLERQLLGVGIDPSDHSEAGYGLVFRSAADATDLVEEIDGLRDNFEHYDTHVLTTVRAEAGESAVVSLWANRRAATIASGFLGDVNGVNPGIGAPLDVAADGTVPADADDTASDDANAVSMADNHPGGSSDDVEGIREELADLGVYAGQPHGEDVYAVVLYSEADPGDVAEEVASFRGRFEEYDTHVKTAVYEAETDAPSAVVSLWESTEAAQKAGGFLAEVPGVIDRPTDHDGFGTMGMFYTVDPAHREDFIERFDEVGDLLTETAGHRETALLVNRSDENDMFIASQWRSKEDALEFFRSETFRETVAWGRDILADRPRHVFLT